jgi:lysophospholipase L1-like esterase
VVATIALLASGCSSGDPDETLRLDVPETMRVEVGSVVEHAFGSAGLEWTARGLPPDAVLDGNTLRWLPEDAGAWTVELTVSDAEGNRSALSTTLLARHPTRPEALVALGDSVASGHGLDLSDYLLQDPCWRAEQEAYPARVLDRWRTADPGAEPRLALVACSGAGVADLLEEPVTGGLDGTAPDDADELSQVEWAVRANPGLVSLTIGANDLQFTDPEQYLVDGHLDIELVERRTAKIGAGLEAALTRLVDATDARIVVSTYHDPTAPEPNGVDGCNGSCFADAAAQVVDRLDTTIRDAVTRLAADRVALADVQELFEDHRAPNGLGPDSLRAGDGPGPLGVLFDRTTGTIQAYCASGHPDHESWINSIDCVHPDSKGADAYAEAVWEAAEGLREANALTA